MSIKSPGQPVNAATTDANTFTATLTGYASGPTGTITYKKVGNLVTLYATAAILGTSNSTGLGMTGLSAAVTPTQTQVVRCDCMTDNSARISGSAQVGSNGVITFLADTVTGALINSSATGFTGSGTKGLSANWSITYAV